MPIRRQLRTAAGRLRRALGPAEKQIAPRSVVAPPPVRFDPLPPLRPFPKAKYVFVVGAVPRRFGGRTASILNKCRLLKLYGGVDSIIVTLNYSAEIDDISADLRARGLLVDGVEIVNLHDFFDDESVVPSEPVQHEIDEPGMDKIRDPDQEVYRYFENGVYRLYKRFDHSGRLIVRDWFNENRGRTRRDEFNPNGTIRRTTYMDLHFNKPRQEIYYRANGVPYLNKWLVVNPADRTTRVERITEFDEQGRPDRVLGSNVELIHSYLDRLIGDDHAFLSVESRRSDPETLTYHRPNVKHVYVLHNPHLVLPGDDVGNVRPMYQPVLDRHQRGRQDGQVGATVFLTNAQRADAEARYGEQPDFRVIPHPIERVEPTAFAVRDPHLVVMLARLDEQKQIGDAIEAFSHVVASVPGARLEIYGHGPDEVALQRRIDERGLGRQVKLAGYTKDAAGLLRRAAVSLLTSKFEGFGLVLLESLANGCPVVSYDIKYGPSDVVRDGVNGFLVPPRARKAMAARVVELLTDTELRRRMSAAATEIGTEFSEQAFVARWSELFSDLDAEGWGGAEAGSA